MRKHRVYLDTNTVSRIFDSRLQQTDADALAALAERADVQLAGSAAVRDELAKTRDPKRRSLLAFGFRRLAEQLPWETIELSGAVGGAPVGALPLSGSWRHPLLVALEEVFDAPDALHIAQARLSACDFFLTFDHATILSRRGSMSAVLRDLLAPLELCDPTELMTRLNGFHS